MSLHVKKWVDSPSEAGSWFMDDEERNEECVVAVL
jgi:hypothetical protein